METSDLDGSTEPSGTAVQFEAAVSPAPVDLIAPSKAALILGINRRTLYRHAKARLVTKYLTPGGHGRFSESEIRALQARLTVAATAVALPEMQGEPDSQDQRLRRQPREPPRPDRGLLG